MRISDWSSDVCSSYLNGQRVAVLAVAELELALEVGAPQIVRCQPRRQGCAGGSMPGPADRLDKAVAVQHGVDRALGWHPPVASPPPHPDRMRAIEGKSAARRVHLGGPRINKKK